MQSIQMRGRLLEVANLHALDVFGAGRAGHVGHDHVAAVIVGAAALGAGAALQGGLGGQAQHAALPRRHAAHPRQRPFASLGRRRHPLLRPLPLTGLLRERTMHTVSHNAAIGDRT
jgi:hypothetical protein